MRNKTDKNIFFAICISLTAHLLFFAIIFLPHDLNSSSDAQRRVIVTRLVALGIPRNEKILPRISTEASEPPKEIIINTESAEPSTKTEKIDEKKKKDEFSRRLLSSINKVKKMMDTRDSSYPIGDLNGSPFGDSTEGQYGDVYLTEIYNRIRGNYIVPDIINEKQRKELQAIVVIYIDPTGRLIKTEFEKKSGNPHFDNALLNAIKKSSPFKPPPKERTKEYRTIGIGINFSIE